MEPILLTSNDYHVIGPEDFGAPGLIARESIGSFADVLAFGSLVAVHDSTFEAHSGIGHHPHRGMERLFYILEGTVDHDDSLNQIQGHMATGDLGILTEGERGMLHSEWNNTDGPGRCYIFVYPTDPTPETASFDAIRDVDCPREQVAPGVVTKWIVTRQTTKLHGDFRELGDTTLETGSAFTMKLEETEPGLIFVVDGHVIVLTDDGDTVAATGDTVLIPPEPHARAVHIEAAEPTRLLHAITGLRYGLHVREFPRHEHLNELVKQHANR